MTVGKRVAFALVFSFAIYLTPLVGPHAVFLLGEVIWRDLWTAFPGQGGRNFAWVVTDVGVALFAQVTFLLLAYWLFGRPGWLRGLLVGASFVFAMMTLNHAY